MLAAATAATRRLRHGGDHRDRSRRRAPTAWELSEHGDELWLTLGAPNANKVQVTATCKVRNGAGIDFTLAGREGDPAVMGSSSGEILKRYPKPATSTRTSRA